MAAGGTESTGAGGADDGETHMITGITIVSVWVLDQDSAKEFYVEKLGCELTNDIVMDNGMRWLTVRAPGEHGTGAVVDGPVAFDARRGHGRAGTGSSWPKVH